MKQIPVEEAVGSILCHDITQILPGKFKGRKFEKRAYHQRRGYPCAGYSLGKEHIFVWENQPGMVHENDAATLLKDITMGEGLDFGEIKEGKIGFSDCQLADGVLKVDADKLLKSNMLGEMSFACLDE